MEKLDDFIDNDVEIGTIFEYYFVFIPEIIRLILPVAVLLAALFTVGRMSNQSELTALRSSGVSIYKFLVPFLVTALIISVFAVFFGGYVTPIANKSKIYIEQTYLKKGIVNLGTNISFQDSDTRIVTITYYDTRIDQANRVSIQNFDKDDVTRMVSRIDAARMKYDSEKKSWILYNGVKRIFHSPEVKMESFGMMELTDLNFTPEDVIKKQRKPEEMSFTELDDFTRNQLRAGNDPTAILIEYHSRIALAFSSFIVVLFGIPISAAKRRRGGLAIQFGICLLITFIYLVFMKISQAFGKNGLLDPIITSWMANAIFLVASLFILFKARK